MSRFAVLNIGQLVSLRGPSRPRVGPEMRDLGIIEGGGLLVENGKVVAMGTSRDIESQLKPDDSVTDAAGRIVTPGLVDAHTHLVFGGDRSLEFEERALGKSYEQIALAGGGIRKTMWDTRYASPEELASVTRMRALWLLRNGTTTAEAKSGYGLSVGAELKSLRVLRDLNASGMIHIVPTFLGAHALPPEFEARKADYVNHLIDDMLPKIAGEKLAEFCDAFLELRYFDHDDVRRVFRAAKELGLGLRLHTDQFTNIGGAKVAAELRCRTADHLEMTEPEGLRALKAADVIPVLLPASVASLGKGRYPDAREMIAQGLPIVIATDFNPGSSPTPSLPYAMHLACIHLEMTPAEALTAVTVNAAHSVNRGNVAGSLRGGGAADFVIWEATDYRELAYWVGVELASEVFVSGVRVFAR